MAYADEYDSLVLQTMCDEPGAWTREEIERELGDGIAAVDALNRLATRGLILKLENGLIITTAAGRYANAVDQGAA